MISESTLTCEHYFLKIPKSLGKKGFSDRLLELASIRSYLNQICFTFGQ